MSEKIEVVDSPTETPAASHQQVHQVVEAPVKQSRLNRAMLRELNRQRVIIILLVILAVIGISYFGYKYHQSQNTINRLSNPQESAKAEVARITSAVGQLVDIPKNETPTVATVSDASKLKDQSFFAKAENGDKVLIFSQAKIAILYRPSTNKVIQIAPLNIGESTTNTSTTPTTTTKPSTTTGR